MLNWGVIGAGKIAFDFIRAQDKTEREHKIVAVAASSKDRAQKLIDELNITDAKAYGNYEDVIKDPNVHVVYIALHNEAHNPWCRRAIEAGKPVLCEKPLAVNTREVKEVIELAQKKKVLLVEAFWSRWFPAFQYIKNIVQSGELGEPKVVHSVFGYPHKLK